MSFPRHRLRHSQTIPSRRLWPRFSLVDHGLCRRASENFRKIALCRWFELALLPIAPLPIGLPRLALGLLVK